MKRREKTVCVNSRPFKNVIERIVGKFCFVCTLETQIGDIAASKIVKLCGTEEIFHGKIFGFYMLLTVLIRDITYTPLFSSMLMMFVQHVCVENYEKRYTHVGFVLCGFIMSLNCDFLCHVPDFKANKFKYFKASQKCFFY